MSIAAIIAQANSDIPAGCVASKAMDWVLSDKMILQIVYF